jgi:flavin-dependent dehydrogenase
LPNQPEVLIAGAGPAGSALAVRLARHGHRVLLVDRAVFPRDKACSEYLSPAAVQQLGQLGVVDDLISAGAQPLLGTRVIARKGATLTGSFMQMPAGETSRQGLAVARTILDARLVQAAKDSGAELREATAVDELIYQNGAVAGVVVRDRSGRRSIIRSRIVIGADGLRSIVARRIGRRRHLHPNRLAFVAHVGGVSGLDGHAEMHVGPTGYVGLNRIAAGDTANVALVVPARIATLARGRVAAFFFEMLERFPGVAGRVRSDGLVREVLTTGPFAAWSGRTVVDGALLVGDAADFFDPFTGEGIYSALRGAELASETVHQALTLDCDILPASGLRSYQVARRKAFLGKWAVERLVGYGMLAPALFSRAVRKLEDRGLAHTFVGVTADVLPARMVLNPWFLARMVL